MGYVHALPDDYCVSFQTQDLDDQEYPNIQAIVSYHIDTWSGAGTTIGRRDTIISS